MRVSRFFFEVGEKILLTRIFTLIGGFDQQILNNENQISSLTQLRDTLLPELISGEIAVNVAESVNKEVI
jgi:type I restriction enzyme S subunit